MTEVAKAAAILAEIRQKRFQPPPKGWFSLAGYMDYADCGRTRAYSDMKKLIKAGKLEFQKWPVLDVSGRTTYITIYKNI